MSNANSSKVGPVSYFVCSQGAGYLGARTTYKSKADAWKAVAELAAEIDALPGARIWVESCSDGGTRASVWSSAAGSSAWAERIEAHRARWASFYASRLTA